MGLSKGTLTFTRYRVTGITPDSLVDFMDSQIKLFAFRELSAGTDEKALGWTSLDNVLDYCEIRNAGSNYVYCCNDKAGIYLRSGQIKVSNSLISKSGGCGISVRSGAALTESGNIYSENTDGNICN